MKKILIASILAAGFAGSAFACGNQCPPVAAPKGISGTAASISGSAAIATSSGNGGSISKAGNSTYSSVSYSGNSQSSFNVDVNKYCLPTGSTAQGSASIKGDVATGSESFAVNKSWGNGTGGAAAGGLSTATVAGANVYAAPLVGGAVLGAATSTTGNAVIAGKNTGGYVVADNVAGFEANADSSQVNKFGWFSVSTKNVANTDASAYSVSDKFSIGNATILNTNSGTAAAGAVSFAGVGKNRAESRD